MSDKKKRLDEGYVPPKQPKKEERGFVPPQPPKHPSKPSEGKK